jgi:hypothetical protein
MSRSLWSQQYALDECDDRFLLMRRQIGPSMEDAFGRTIFCQPVTIADCQTLAKH